MKVSKATSPDETTKATGKCPICEGTYSIRSLPLHSATCGEEQKKPKKKHEALSPTISKKRTLAKKPTKSWTTHALMQSAVKRKHSLLKPQNENERGVPGFYVFDEIMDMETELSLIKMANETKPEFTDQKHRFAKNYGPPYNIAERRFDFEKPRLPLPPYAGIVMDLVRQKVQMVRDSDFKPNQLATQLYDPSRQGKKNVHILPHNDLENGAMRHFIVGVTLQAPCIMTLILQAKDSGCGKDIKRDVRLPRRSVYIMSGSALSMWRHGIFAGNTFGARLSLTFREVLLPNYEGPLTVVMRMPSQQTEAARAAAKRRAEARRIKALKPRDTLGGFFAKSVCNKEAQTG